MSEIFNKITRLKVRTKSGDIDLTNEQVRNLPYWFIAELERMAYCEDCKLPHIFTIIQNFAVEMRCKCGRKLHLVDFDKHCPHELAGELIKEYEQWI